MDFVTEIDKQAIRMGAYIIFLEQLAQQQKQQIDQLRGELNAKTVAGSSSAGEASDAGKSEVSEQK